MDVLASLYLSAHSSRTGNRDRVFFHMSYELPAVGLPHSLSDTRSGALNYVRSNQGEPSLLRAHAPLHFREWQYTRPRRSLP